MINYPGQPTHSAKVPPGTFPANGTMQTWLAAWARLNR